MSIEVLIFLVTIGIVCWVISIIKAFQLYKLAKKRKISDDQLREINNKIIREVEIIIKKELIEANPQKKEEIVATDYKELIKEELVKRYMILLPKDEFDRIPWINKKISKEFRRYRIVLFISFLIAVLISIDLFPWINNLLGLQGYQIGCLFLGISVSIITWIHFVSIEVQYGLPNYF